MKSRINAKNRQGFNVKGKHVSSTSIVPLDSNKHVEVLEDYTEKEVNTAPSHSGETKRNLESIFSGGETPNPLQISNFYIIYSRLL